MRIIAVLLLAMSLASCASVAPSSSERRPVPGNRVFMASIAPSANTANIVVVRDQGFFFSGVFFHFSIDGKRAASLNPGEEFSLTLPAGEYLFDMVPTDPLGTQAGFSIDQTLKAGRTYHYRLLADMNSGARIQRDNPR